MAARSPTWRRVNDGLGFIRLHFALEGEAMHRLIRLGGIFLAGALSAGAVVLPVGATTTNAPPTNALAQRALLVLSDFPTSWTSTRVPGTNSSLPGATQLASCIGVPRSVLTSHPPSSTSPEFSSANQQLSVIDGVSIYPSAKAASADYNSLANVKTPSCMARILNGPAKGTFEKQLGAASLVGRIRVTRSAATMFAPGAANLTLMMGVKSLGTRFNFEMTIVVYVKATVEQTMMLISVNTKFPAALAKNLTTDAVRLIQ